MISFSFCIFHSPPHPFKFLFKSGKISTILHPVRWVLCVCVSGPITEVWLEDRCHHSRTWGQLCQHAFWPLICLRFILFVNTCTEMLFSSVLWCKTLMITGCTQNNAISLSEGLNICQHSSIHFSKGGVGVGVRKKRRKKLRVLLE